MCGDVNETDKEEYFLETPLKRYTPNDNSPINKFRLPITILRLIPRNSKVLKRYLALTNALLKPTIDTCAFVVYLPSSEASPATKGSGSSTLKRKVVAVPATAIKMSKTAVYDSSGTNLTSPYEIAPMTTFHISSLQSKGRNVHARRKGQRSFGSLSN